MAPQPLAMLGGLTAAQFMQRHWQRKPLLVRGAFPALAPVLARAELFALAGRDDVESRLVVHQRQGWSLAHGPITRRSLPPLAQRAWTLLVQGVDLQVPAAHALLQQFRFVPDARMDDMMVSYATDGGGVGPHFDSYDVFLLQAQGRRRWRYGRQKDLTLKEGLPLKILAHFEPEFDEVLEPGDMLYLPPRYAHDGIAEGECQTYSIGFRAPSRGELAQDLLQRLADDARDAAGEAIFSDAGHPPAATPAEIPASLASFARDALDRVLADGDAFARALGESLTEPKPNVSFGPGAAPRPLRGVRLDARTRMMHDARHVFVNGDSWRAGGADARLLRKLAHHRALGAADLRTASTDALDLLRAWCEAGWAHATEDHDGTR